MVMKGERVEWVIWDWTSSWPSAPRTEIGVGLVTSGRECLRTKVESMSLVMEPQPMRAKVKIVAEEVWSFKGKIT